MVEDPVFQRASASLPSCYSDELDKCLQEEHYRSPECSEFYPINQAYEADYDVSEAMVDSLPFCPEPSDALVQEDKSKLLQVAAISAISGLALGVLAGYMLRG